jgi:bifunctional lysine-specific demethylase and histidyl-hydroxylase NO66
MKSPERVAARLGVSGAALARCVGDIDSFFSATWSRGPLLQHGREPDGFDDLLTLEDVDFILTTTALRTPAFRLVKQGKQLDERFYTKWAGVGARGAHGAADPGKVFSLFQEGATIVLQAMQRYWLPLAHFVRDLELTLTLPAQANAYITPPGSRGLAVHYDTHDVFVLQVAGKKHWEVFDPVIEAPLPSQHSMEDEVRAPVLEADLEPGDTLYIPRGWRHAATAEKATSAHLTIGVLNYAWYDVFQEVLSHAKDELAFRESLPVAYAAEGSGFAEDLSARLRLLRDWLQRVDVEDVATTLRRRFWSARAPTLVGQMAQLDRLDDLSGDSLVRRRVGAICLLEFDQESGRLRAILGDRELAMPGELEPTMRMILDRGVFQVKQLEDLDEESRIRLVRRLIVEGLLEVPSN